MRSTDSKTDRWAVYLLRYTNRVVVGAAPVSPSVMRTMSRFLESVDHTSSWIVWCVTLPPWVIERFSVTTSEHRSTLQMTKG